MQSVPSAVDSSGFGHASLNISCSRRMLRQEHPDWKDRVAIVPISIDDTLPVLRDHLQKRGWTNTFNVWAGEGGWQSAPAKTFRVTGVPTTYIIGPQGTIVRAGHPAAMNIGDIVNTQLNPVGKVRNLFKN